MKLLLLRLPLISGLLSPAASTQLLQLPSSAYGQAEYEGIYRIKQKATGRYLDAYEHDNEEGTKTLGHSGYEVVTRSAQYAPVRDGFDKTQFWVLTKDKGDAYSVMQYTSGRFLEAAGDPEPGHVGVELFTSLPNMTEECIAQSWYVSQVPDSNDSSLVTFTQASTQRVLGASADMDRDFEAVAWPLDENLFGAPNLHQEWVLEKMLDRPLPLLDGLYSINQLATDRRVDALHPGEKDTHAVTSDVEFHSSQRFIIRRIMGEVYTIMQQSTGHILGAYPENYDMSRNYTVVTRDCQEDLSQDWMLMRLGYDEFVVMHVPTRRVLSAYTDNLSNHDFRAYTTTPTLASIDGNISSEVWRFKKIEGVPVLDGVYRLRQRHSGRFLTVTGSGTIQTEVIESTAAPTVGEQYWDFQRLAGDIYSVKLNGTDDALETSLSNQVDFSARLMPYVRGNNQQWYAIWLGGHSFRLRQHGTHRYLDAFTDGGAHGWRSMTTNSTPTDSQVWDLVYVESKCSLHMECPATYECGFQEDGCGGSIGCGPMNGSCAKRNPITNQMYRCGDAFVCECVPKEACDAGDCTVQQDDGCGGSLNCPDCVAAASAKAASGAPGAASGAEAAVAKAASGAPAPAPGGPPAAPGGPSAAPGGSSSAPGGPSATNASDETTGAASDLAPATAPCVPIERCDAGMECGFMPDGCGADIICGNTQGICPGAGETNVTCQANKCVCVPDTCEGRCGVFDDGCGETVECGCAMANEMCDHEQGICVHIPQPPPPKDFFEEPVETVLITYCPIGSLKCEVEDNSFFEVGKKIIFMFGKYSESHLLADIGDNSNTIFLRTPLQFFWPEGTRVKEDPAPAVYWESDSSPQLAPAPAPASAPTQPPASAPEEAEEEAKGEEESESKDKKEAEEQTACDDITVDYECRDSCGRLGYVWKDDACEACGSGHSWTGRRRFVKDMDCPSGYIPDATPSLDVQTGCCKACGPLGAKCGESKPCCSGECVGETPTKWGTCKAIKEAGAEAAPEVGSLEVNLTAPKAIEIAKDEVEEAKMAEAAFEKALAHHEVEPAAWSLQKAKKEVEEAAVHVDEAFEVSNYTHETAPEVARLVDIAHHEVDHLEEAVEHVKEALEGLEEARAAEQALPQPPPVTTAVHLQNIDHVAVEHVRSTHDQFVEAIVEAVAEKSGVDAHQVHVAVEDGSEVAQITIEPHKGTDPADVASPLADSGDLAAAVSSKVSEVSSAKADPNLPIQVDDVSAPKIATPPPTQTSPTPAIMPPTAVISSVHLQNIDHASVDNNDTKADGVADAIQEAVAEESGVPVQYVHITLEEGSDVAEIAVIPPVGFNTSAVTSPLSNTSEVAETVASALSEVPGVKANPTQAIMVDGVASPEISTPPPTEAPTLPAAVVTSVHLQNINRASIDNNHTTHDAVADAIQQAVAEESGVPVQDVQVTLEAGSDVAEIAVTPPIGVNTSDVISPLNNLYEVAERVASAVSNVPNATADPSQAVMVDDVSSPELSTPLPTQAPTLPEVITSVHFQNINHASIDNNHTTHDAVADAIQQAVAEESDVPVQDVHVTLEEGSDVAEIAVTPPVGANTSDVVSPLSNAGEIAEAVASAVSEVSGATEIITVGAVSSPEVSTPPIQACNWQCYLDRYTDLQRVLGASNTEAAKIHYQNHGQSEGRDCTCAEAATSPTAVITEVHIQNINHTSVDNNHTTHDAVADALRQAVAEESGVPVQDVNVTLEEGSDVAEIAVTPPVGVNASEVIAPLSDANELAETVASEVSEVLNATADPSQAITVDNVSSPELLTPPPTQAATSPVAVITEVHLQNVNHASVDSNNTTHDAVAHAIQQAVAEESGVPVQDVHVTLNDSSDVAEIAVTPPVGANVSEVIAPLSHAIEVAETVASAVAEVSGASKGIAVDEVSSPEVSTPTPTQAPGLEVKLHFVVQNVDFGSMTETQEAELKIGIETTVASSAGVPESYVVAHLSAGSISVEVAIITPVGMQGTTIKSAVDANHATITSAVVSYAGTISGLPTTGSLGVTGFVATTLVTAPVSPTIVTSVHLQNINHASMGSNDSTADAVVDAVQQAVAEESGVDPQHVQVTLEDDSDVAEITVTPPEGVDPDKVVLPMGDTADLAHTVAGKVSEVPGVKADPSHAIEVDDVSSPKVETPPPTPAPAPPPAAVTHIHLQNIDKEAVATNAESGNAVVNALKEAFAEEAGVDAQEVKVTIQEGSGFADIAVMPSFGYNDYFKMDEIMAELSNTRALAETVASKMSEVPGVKADPNMGIGVDGVSLPEKTKPVPKVPPGESPHDVTVKAEKLLYDAKAEMEEAVHAVEVAAKAVDGAIDKATHPNNLEAALEHAAHEAKEAAEAVEEQEAAEPPAATTAIDEAADEVVPMPAVPPAIAATPAGPPAPAKAMQPEEVKPEYFRLYIFFYYFFYYYNWDIFRAAKVQPAEAAARAEALAKPSAHEQLRRMLGDPAQLKEAAEDPVAAATAAVAAAIKAAEGTTGAFAVAPAQSAISRAVVATRGEVYTFAAAKTAAAKSAPGHALSLGQTLWDRLMAKNGVAEEIHSDLTTGLLQKVHRHNLRGGSNIVR